MIKFILWLFSIMPLRLNHFIGTLIGRILYISNSKLKNVITKNIELCFPKIDKQKQKKLIKKTILETGKSITEASFIWYNDFNHNALYVKKINGIDYLNSSKSIILLVPHFGCWEIIRIIALKYKLTCLYKPMKNIKFEKILAKKRVNNNKNMTLAKTDIIGVKKLQNTLTENGIVLILPDQDPGERGGVFSTFFNQKVKTMTLLTKLCRKNNSKVLLTWGKRLAKGKGYEINIKPIDILSKTNKLEDDLALMNKAIEDLIKTQPEQYLWSYEKFKSAITY